MFPRKIRKKRPTMQAAHEWHRGAAFSIGPSDYVSREEYEKILEGVHDDICSVAMRQFPRTQNLEYAILKGHLVIEHAITHFIRCHALAFVDIEKIKFSFSQKLEISYLMGFGAYDPILIPTIERWNKIRNQVAHSFELSRDMLDEMLVINSGNYDDLKIDGDKSRVKHLRHVCRRTCGVIAGEILASHYVWNGEQGAGGGE